MPLPRPLARAHRRTHAPRRAAALARALSVVALGGLALLGAGCASDDSGHADIADHAAPAPAAPRGAPTREAAHDLQFTEMSEIRFGGELVGYLVNVLPVPGGIVDSRPWPPGTALIQDKSMQFIGFISPRGTTYRFDVDGEARGTGFGSRDASIAAFFKRNGQPEIVSLQPALKSGS